MLTNQSNENVFCRFHAACRTWIYILESDSQGSQTTCFSNHEVSCVLMKHLSYPQTDDHLKLLFLTPRVQSYLTGQELG